MKQENGNMVNMLKRRCSAKRITPFFLFIAVGFTVLTLQAATTMPAPLSTMVKQGVDRQWPVENITIWHNVPGGSDDTACSNREDCSHTFRANTLVCYSEDQTAHGACPTMPIWKPESTDVLSLRLDFTHAAGEKKTLTLQAKRKISDIANSWRVSSLSAQGSPMNFNVYIPATELTKLDKPGQWTAALSMQVVGWRNCPDAATIGCLGQHLADWNATISLTVTDNLTQQIYFPEFKHTNPRIDLNLNHRPGQPERNLMVSGSASLDMCLYDGSDSNSHQVRLFFEDEGSNAPGRAIGQFSIYRDGADKGLAENRIDYQISVINPTTGANQPVLNRNEIIWSDTNRRNILRPVVLSGIPGVSLCVPAPITLITPLFILAEKAAGNFTGTLRIIYTPTT